ncbi:hypothetical protein [Kribbella sp. NPDC000426]|uniref:hypothetical protein n=1 Tax=Kribbella sp. NPDC000426 TaxID=3154255 RepID=UPI00332ED6B8
MSDLQLWDGLIGALIGAAVGAVPAVLALRSSRKSNELTAAAHETAKAATEEARQATAAMVANEISAAALEEARQANAAAVAANAIADSALEEARAARKIQYDEWHRQATPNIILELGRERHELGGHALKFSCDRDIDSGELTLAAGYDEMAITGLGASPDEEVFNFGRSVTLPRGRSRHDRCQRDLDRRPHPRQRPHRSDPLHGDHRRHQLDGGQTGDLPADRGRSVGSPAAP